MYVKETGQISDKIFMFNTLYLTTEEYEQNEVPLEYLAERNKADFIVVIKNDKVSFEHYTTEINADGIIGANTFNNPTTIGDLGIGTYAIPCRSHHLHCEGYDNICTFFTDFSEEYIYKVSGEFNGKFGICVYGYQHEGYLVLKEGDYNIFDAEPIYIEDFLLGV